MRLAIILLSAYAFVLSAGAALQERIPIMASFGFWASRVCDGPSDYHLVAYGAPCDNSCHNFTSGSVNPYYYYSVREDSINPQCLLTVFIKPDCSDPGIQSGTGGCWAPEGGIGGYKLTCPWRQPAALPVCA